jgi:glutamyl-tRNA synthetase
MVNDLFHGYRRFPLPASMQYFVVRKKDGFPAYQLTSVVDDIHFGVDMVVRGEDLFDSTLAQVYLSQLLAVNTFGQTAFFHHPLVQDAHGRKLSKSAGDRSVRHFRDQGKSPRDFLAEVSRLLSLQGPADSWSDIFGALCVRWGIDDV